MLSLEITDEVLSRCKLGEDPERRTDVIHFFRDFPVDLDRVASILKDANTDPDLRSALCLSVGTLGPDAQRSTGEALEHCYREALDPGTHSAARWALEQQGVERPELTLLPGDFPESTTREWYVNTVGMTMLKIPSGSFRRERRGEAVLQEVFVNSFWLSDTEVSVGLFQDFNRHWIDVYGDRPGFRVARSPSGRQASEAGRETGTDE